MQFLARITGEGCAVDVPLLEVTVERGLGCPVSIRLVLMVTDGYQEPLLRELSRGPVVLGVGVDGDELIQAVQGCGIKQSPRAPALVEMGATAASSEQQGGAATLARFRVHKGGTWSELFEGLQPRVRLSRWVKNHLLSSRVHPSATVQVLQNGLTDWEFLHLLLSLYRRQRSFNADEDLIVSQCFSAAARLPETWRVDWAQPQAARSGGDVTQVELSRLTANGGGTWQGATAPVKYQIGSSTLQARSYRTYPREFNTQSAQRWLGNTLPLWDSTEKASIWRVCDHFKLDDERILWTTELYDVYERAHLGPSYHEPPAVPTPWLVEAVVKDRDPRRPTLTVSLPGFESGADELDVALASAYSGPDERTGLHFVPEKNTTVLICGSGGAEPFPTCLGNLRRQATSMDAPAQHVAASVSLAYDALKLTLAKGGELSSARDLSLRADSALSIRGAGAGLKLSGGKAEFSRG